jgi:hypothetical protein
MPQKDRWRNQILQRHRARRKIELATASLAAMFSALEFAAGLLWQEFVN